jgi:membrane associated rhomboid family serine protease
MANIIDELKLRFRNGDMLTRLLYVNCGVWLVAAVWLLAARLFTINGDSLVRWLELPANLQLLARQPWSVVTYMFLHVDFLHLLFNMLWLYWFGGIFLRYFTEKQLTALYLLGGLSGAVLYVVLYNLLPLFSGIASGSFLLGASAAVMAIVVAVAVRVPDQEVLLMFLGAVKLKYIAAFVVLLSFLSMAGANAGGNIAHLGGALFGFLFARQYRRGHDLTRGLNRLLDRLFTLFRPKPKMRVRMGDKQKDMDYNRRKREEMADIDAILDKIKRTGYDGLTAEEKRRLFNAGKNHR